MDVPETCYAKSGDLHIAYQVIGDGEIDIVHVPGILFSLEAGREEPLAVFHEQLARFARVILFDKRGTGLSDRLPPDATPTIEERIDDVRAVMDAAGVERAALVGIADGGPVAMFFAATHPERTAALALSATGARSAWASDYPWGYRREVAAKQLESIERAWGTGMMAPFFAASDDNRLIARYERLAGTPTAAAAVSRMNYATDVRDVLPTITCRTLIVHNEAHPIWPIEGARYLAEHIPNARLIELPGRPTGLGASRFLELIEEFLTGERYEPEVDRVLKTVLFTDIVGSTDRQRRSEIGGGRNCSTSTTGRSAMRSRGSAETEVKTTGDGFLAAFDGPARAIRCALAIGQAARRLGLEVRAGLHTGECEVRGHDPAGIAVHIGARVAALAGPGEVLATSTVRDLVAGSGIEFGDRGRHALKGVPGEWDVLAVRG